jgi:OmpA-OmpF porin, OOP family
MSHVRKPAWTTWAMIGVAAALAAAVVTVYEAVVSDRTRQSAAAPAPDSHGRPAAPATLAREPSAPAPRPAAGEVGQPDSTGSIAQAGLAPGERERPPALAVVAPEGPYRLSLRREAGALVLTGFVPDAAVRAELAAFARERFFQERIVDETRLANGAPPRFLHAARYALDQLSQLASGEAVIAGASLRLQGEALYAQLAEEIEGKVARKPPTGFKGSAEIRAREAEPGEAQ